MDFFDEQVDFFREPLDFFRESDHRPEWLRGLTQSLTAEEYRQAEALVTRHRLACKRQGAEIENIRAVWRESIETVKRGDDLDAREPVSDFPYTNYSVYQSPRV